MGSKIICFTCIDNCEDCIDSTSCDRCFSNFAFDGSICKCTNGRYL